MSADNGNGDGGPGRREVAYRLFAAEFEDADYSYSESDEERAPNYVVTPTGARVNRLFAVGVLTEVETVGDGVLRGRVVDPTGAFVLYAGQYQPDERAALDAADTPTFVAVTGKARTFQPEDSDRVFTSIRPESISEVDAATRDRWTVQTAEQTLERVGHAAAALGLDGDDLREALEARGVEAGLAAGIPLAVDHYGTTPAYLAAVRELALDAARLVAGDLDEVPPLDLAPDAPGDADLDALAATVGHDDTDDARETDESASPAEETGAGGEATDSAHGTPSTTAGDVERTATEASVGDESTTAGGDDSGRPTRAETADTGGDADAAGEAAGEPTGVDGDVDAEPATSEESQSGEPTPGEEEIDPGDFEPGEFELDEDEREEIESEFGTEFQSGTEVSDPGEADIETPEPDAEPPAEADDGGEGDETAAGTEPAEPADDGPAADVEPSAEGDDVDDAATGAVGTDDGDLSGVGGADTGDSSDAVDGEDSDVDLEDAVLAVTDELDDGDGADRNAVVETVADRHGVAPDAVEEAIQDALMGGRCYEPDDARLKSI